VSNLHSRLPLGALLCWSVFAAACSGGATNGATVVPTNGLLSTVTVRHPPAASRLGKYNINPRRVFVAGISSGGFFGVQMHVAHSKTFKGAAIYAGGVYYCAQDNIGIALGDCGGEGLYQSTLAQSEAYLDQQSAAGTIDPKSNLSGQPVYLWSGTLDTIVNPKEMNDLDTEYQHYGARASYDNGFPAGHGWESPDGELVCGTQASPYMIKCDQASSVYDSEKTWLTMFLGTLRPRNNGALRGTLINFDQTEFGAGPSNSMDTNGYVFVPRHCASGGRCGMIVALHGCQQTQPDIGTKFVTESGIDEWADTNGLVVLYPYAVRSQPSPYNPQGCWDWWGYDDPGYSLKSGTQVSIVYKMVQRVTGRP
jgi:poly(3-hydroxybutyrate) depolymerase